jgi:catechol 2,3-dioxygenase-like lactoylglutathione lyase family enzyme
MSRVQLALRVADLEESIAFYSKLFGTEPAKRREGYANFAVAEPPLKLVLIEGEADEATRLDHLGVEVESTDHVTAATERLREAGLATVEENDTSCCYALQDKVWVTGPGKEPGRCTWSRPMPSISARSPMWFPVAAAARPPQSGHRLPPAAPAAADRSLTGSKSKSAPDDPIVRSTSSLLRDSQQVSEGGLEPPRPIKGTSTSS